MDPARLRNGCVFIDDAVKRTFRNAAIAALQPLRDPTDDTDDSLRLARQTLPGTPRLICYERRAIVDEDRHDRLRCQTDDGGTEENG